MKKPALCMGTLFTLLTINLSASTTVVQDSCNMNDVCETATEVLNVQSDFPFVCITACNTTATPEVFSNSCGVGEFPTTWFKVVTDDFATLMNIFVNSEFDKPTISLYYQVTDCTNLQPVSLTASQFPCVIGIDGEAEALGSNVGGNSTYYIAISTHDGQTGEFELCVNTISLASNCVIDRNIEVTARSYGGPIEGPYFPGEMVSICMNVNSFTAANNGCQWFQGIVPVFGNGWDPSSFDGNGQPLHAVVNGEGMGISGNGIYGSTTWDWFTDVDHHYDNPFLQVGDADGNGTLDMCHLLYSADCPNFGGINGGCCGPCWANPSGTILPGGWFAYGINGSCGTPGPPIGVDWGDGNTCGSGMGPWKFCFDLQVRDYPDCTEDETHRDLSLSFFTFADGQIGAWTGSSSICAFDQQAKVTLPVQCENIFIDLASETLFPICSGDSLHFQIEYPDVSYWTWTISPGGYVQQPVYEGDNGFVINTAVINTTSAQREITFSFVGHFDTAITLVRKEVKFVVYPQIGFSLPDRVLCERDSSVFLSPTIVGGTGAYHFQWSTGAATPYITLIKPFISQVILHVSDDIGCMWSDTMQIKTRPCHLGDTLPPTDDDNEPDHPKDPPPPIEDISSPNNQLVTRANAPSRLLVYPVPAQEAIVVGWSDGAPLTSESINIADMNGKVIMQVTVEDKLKSKLSIDIADLPAGVYYLSCFSATGVDTAKLVKL